MRSYSTTFIQLAGVCAAVMLCASGARGQCAANSRGFDEIGIVPGNPFSAELVTIRSDSSGIQENRPVPPPQMVARDVQGRVRVERVHGHLKSGTGPEPGLEQQLRSIVICDTTAETLTQIDTLNRTAKIMHARPSGPKNPAATWTFCSVWTLSAHGPNASDVDLGDQIIEGLSAHGARFLRSAQVSGIGEAPATDTSQEIWCSDDLVAIVLKTAENIKTGTKTSLAMRKIVRAEPDPALFQIPADYAVTESVAPEQGIRAKSGETGGQK
ncbi:MAG TPA: hypothetical protein VEF54_00580 [archaeon]|nr:hypothetical protein [archaeon]